MSDFGSGHDLTVCEFEPHVGLCADSSEPGACFRFYVSLSLYPSPACALSLPLKNEQMLKKKKSTDLDHFPLFFFRFYFPKNLTCLNQLLKRNLLKNYLLEFSKLFYLQIGKQDALHIVILSFVQLRS